MKNKILFSVLMLGGSVSYSAQNATAPSFFSAWSQGHFVVQAGGYWSTQGKEQHINIVDLIGDEFTVSDHNDSNGLVGLGYFIDGNHLGQAQLSYGVDAFYLPKTSVTGVVWQENLFDNLSYSYNTTSFPVYAVAKANTQLPINRLSLTVDAGIGPNFMRTGGFVEHSRDGGMTIPDNAFSGRTATTFSATVGAGLQIAEVFGSMPLECGYRFFYLGEGHFNRNTNQIINNLSTGSIYANAVMCAVHV